MDMSLEGPPLGTYSAPFPPLRSIWPEQAPGSFYLHIKERTLPMTPPPCVALERAEEVIKAPLQPLSSGRPWPGQVTSAQ